MRVSVQNNRRRRQRLLVVRGSRQERMVGVQARGLMESDEPTLLPLAAEPAMRGGRPWIVYDALGCVSVRSRAKQLTALDVQRICWDLLSATQWCARHRFPNTALLCDVRYACLTPDMHLRVAFVPIDRGPRALGESPLSLLAWLDALAIKRFANPSDEVLVRELHALVTRSYGIFSVNRLAAFVRAACGEEPGDLDRPGDGARHWLVRADTGESYPLELGRTYLLGRDRSCDICIRGARRVSRRHAEVTCSAQGVRVCDAGSTNGTFVGGRRLAPHEAVLVRPGERFGLFEDVFWIERR
ncbi:MAG: FHA domain-containing protein [Coriobacteriales bacterium]|nr:FHA domain-containing protein [Coriobacteriales bacterium]